MERVLTNARLSGGWTIHMVRMLVQSEGTRANGWMDGWMKSESTPKPQTYNFSQAVHVNNLIN